MDKVGPSKSLAIPIKLIKDEYVCEAKGTIKVKGVDQLEIWHVLGKKAA